MRITVIVPSRNRVRGLVSVLTSMDMLESGKHEVKYGVCVDKDDPRTRIVAMGLCGELDVTVRSGPRPVSLGGLVNDMAERMPADVYCSMADDLLMLTPGWDEEIARKVEETPHGVFWWRNALEQDSLFAVVTEKWRAAAGGIFTDYYPFWFDDWHLAELWFMATGQEGLRLDSRIADKPKHTHRLRDLRFWQDFYAFTRHERVRDAKLIAERLGLPRPTHCDKAGSELDARLKPLPMELIRQIEQQGDSGEPGPEYLAAKARAENIMRRAA